MVKVSQQTKDHATAWRVRDAMARHPLLGGCAVRILVCGERRHVTLNGWAGDRRLAELALHLARRAAGNSSVSSELLTREPSEQ